MPNIHAKNKLTNESFSSSEVSISDVEMANSAFGRGSNTAKKLNISMFTQPVISKKMSFTVTKTQYKKAFDLSFEDPQKMDLVKKLINEGNGPYAALAVDMVCAQIQHGADTLSAGGVLSDQVQSLLQKNKYLEKAIKHSPAIGFYLTVVNTVPFLARPEIQYVFEMNPEAIVKFHAEILEAYFAFKMLLKPESEDYSALLYRDELMQREFENEIKNDDFSPDEIEELRHLLSLDPVSFLEKLMIQAGVLLQGELAEAAQIDANKKVAELHNETVEAAVKFRK